MYLLFAVINDEDILDDLITGWLDIGVTDATILESTDLLQLISHQIPIFAGFRGLTSSGIRHNKTIFTAISEKAMLDKAVEYLEFLCRKTNKPHQGVYFVAPLISFSRLGISTNPQKNNR